MAFQDYERAERLRREYETMPRAEDIAGRFPDMDTSTSGIGRLARGAGNILQRGGTALSGAGSVVAGGLESLFDYDVGGRSMAEGLEKVRASIYGRQSPAERSISDMTKPSAASVPSQNPSIVRTPATSMQQVTNQRNATSDGTEALPVGARSAMGAPANAGLNNMTQSYADFRGQPGRGNIGVGNVDMSGIERNGNVFSGVGRDDGRKYDLMGNDITGMTRQQMEDLWARRGMEVDLRSERDKLAAMEREAASLENSGMLFSGAGAARRRAEAQRRSVENLAGAVSGGLAERTARERDLEKIRLSGAQTQDLARLQSQLESGKAMQSDLAKLVQSDPGFISRGGDSILRKIYSGQPLSADETSALNQYASERTKREIDLIKAKQREQTIGGIPAHLLESAARGDKQARDVINLIASLQSAGGLPGNQK